MNNTRKKLLTAIKKNPESSIRDLQIACGISSASLANYHLMKMEAAGVIRRVRWEIVVKE
jgi:DNA-binding Lrp family transcriptional regulator